jgi:hypothetical protein
MIISFKFENLINGGFFEPRIICVIQVIFKIVDQNPNTETSDSRYASFGGSIFLKFFIEKLFRNYHQGKFTGTGAASGNLSPTSGFRTFAR